MVSAYILQYVMCNDSSESACRLLYEIVLQQQLTDPPMYAGGKGEGDPSVAAYHLAVFFSFVGVAC